MLLMNVEVLNFDSILDMIPPTLYIKYNFRTHNMNINLTYIINTIQILKLC